MSHAHDHDPPLECLRTIYNLLKEGNTLSLEMLSCSLAVGHWLIDWLRTQSSSAPVIFRGTAMQKEAIELMCNIANEATPAGERLVSGAAYAGPGANFVVKMFAKMIIRRIVAELGANLPPWAEDLIKQIEDLLDTI